MPRPKRKEKPPEVLGNYTPRKTLELNLRQERFAYEFMIDLDPGAAYRRAGYEVAEDSTAQDNGRRLLRHAGVMDIIDRVQIALIQKLGVNAENTVLRFHFLYLECMRRKDYSTACRCLENIAKHLGLYEKHNQQKKEYGPGDLDRLKQELTQAGFNLERLELQYPSPN